MTAFLTIDFFKEILRAYLILSLILTITSILRMYRIRRYASDRRRGKERIMTLVRQGRMRQLPIYPMEDIRENKHKGVVRLSVFPNDTGKRTRAIIVCPGGGYAHLCTKDEGYPIAARLNEMGYTAFVLEYRTGIHCSSHAPMHDLARAVNFIERHQEEYNVDIEGYAVIGFSAGGNLAGMFGTHDFGYDHYRAKKPGAVILAYPWTNVNHWIEHPYWNIWVGLFGIWLSERGNLFMFGFGPHLLRKNRDSLCVQKFITADYPPTYMFAGGNDVLVPSGAHTDVLEVALKEKEIPHLYEKFFAVPHGIGLGMHTRAEGWLERAVAFWDTHSGAD